MVKAQNWVKARRWGKIGRGFPAFAFWLGLGLGLTCASAPAPAVAQDLTLTARDGALAVTGTLTSYDGEFYRIASKYGPLTITAAAVICDGPGCPDLTAPKAVIRVTGDGEAGAALLPAVIAAFARARGFDLRLGRLADAPTLLLQAGSETVLAEFTFTPRAPEAARSAMAEAAADLVLARFTPLDAPAKVLALDALVPIVAPSNTVPQLSTANLAAALSGDVTNWLDIGGADMPLVLHGLDTGSDLAAALSARLGQAPVYAKIHANMAELAAAVASDPWALAVTGQASAGAARVVPLADSCGFVLETGAMAVQSDDYPLTLPIYLLTPERRLPLLTREFLDFLALPAAQEAIAAAGFTARNLGTAPLSRDTARLMNAIKAAQDAAGLAQLQRLAETMDGALRAAITFRFEDGSSDLDPAGQDNLVQLANHIAAGQFAQQDMVLVGFTENTGNEETDLANATLLADGVLAGLQALAPDLPAGSWPSIDAFGAALPMACDDTTAGKRLNRRVEVWLRPKG